MNQTQLLLLPVFVHVLMILVIAGRMGRARAGAVRDGEVKLSDIALDGSKWPDEALKLANNYNNQFQLPVLWYAALALLLVTGLADVVSVALSWAFVASRLAHAWIHTGSNAVYQRFQAFAAGFACLAFIWAWFGLRLFVIG